MRKLALFFVAVATTAQAADKYAFQLAGTTGGMVKVVFLPSAAPSSSDAQNPQRWSIEADTPDRIINGTFPAKPMTGDNYSVIPLVALTPHFDGADPATGFPVGTVSYTVVYSQGGNRATITAPLAKPAPAEQSSSSENDLKLYGAINAAVGSKPTYSIDSSMDFHPLLNGFGVIASVKTDSRKRVDPDSFSAGLDYRLLLSTPKSAGPQVIFQGAELQFDYGKVEFDRKGENLNFVSSPYLVLPFVFHTTADKGSVQNLVALDIKAGIEAGDNFRNSLNRGGYGGFVRTLAGGDLNLTLRSFPGFTKVVIASDYEVRLPGKAELFGTTDANNMTTYVLSKKARHYISNSVSFNFNDHWSFTVQHSYGSLPPAFNFTDQKVTLGLKYTLKTK